MAEKRILILIGEFVAFSGMQPYRTLQAFDYEVDFASPNKAKGETVKSVIHYTVDDEPIYRERRGRDLICDVDFDDIDPGDYSSVIIPGGRAPEHLRINQDAVSLVERFAEENKPVCGICHGPLVMAVTGMLDGKRCTGTPRIRPVIEDAGGIWSEPTGEGDRRFGIVVDENLITVPGPVEHPQMVQALIEQLESEPAIEQSRSD